MCRAPALLLLLGTLLGVSACAEGAELPPPPGYPPPATHVSNAYVQNVSYTTNNVFAAPAAPDGAAGAATADTTPEKSDSESSAAPARRSPICADDDRRCASEGCANADPASCEKMGDILASEENLRALDYYRVAIGGYEQACARGSASACTSYRRMTAPGSGAHTYRAPTCEDDPGGCTASAGNVNVNGNGNVIQFFGNVGKVNIGGAGGAKRPARASAGGGHAGDAPK